MPGRVRLERREAVATLIFDHPERRNAISGEMWRAIPLLAEELARDPELRVVVLRGAGEVAFVSGADISEFQEARSGAGARAYDEANARAFGALSRLPMPVVAAIHGFCVGGGCAIALCADLRVAAEDAVFAIPAARLGLGYSAAGLETLARVVGLPAARELFFTASRIDASRALRMGLVNRVVPKERLESEVEELVATLVDNAPLTLRAAKLALRDVGRPGEERDPGAVAAAIAACYESEDYGEGVRAFLEKRRPRFRGR